MDQTQQTPQTPIETPPQTPPQEEKSTGALIGSIIVIVIIIIGGIYFWMTRSSSTGQAPQTPAEGTAGDQSVAPDQQTAALLEQGTSSDVSSIQQDLNATDLNNLDADMKSIDSQL